MPDFGGSSGSTQTVTTSAPWGPLQQPLQDVIAKAGQLYGAGSFTPLNTPFQRTADFTPEQLQAQGMGAARATNGSPLNAAAGNYLSGVLGGSYLSSNPFTSSVANQAAAAVKDQISRSGRYGDNTATARGITEAMAPILNQNYQTERGYQQQAASYAPQLAAQDYIDISALNQIGQDRQAQAQALLNEQAQRFNTQATAPQNALATYLSFLSGSPNPATTTTIGPNTAPSGAQQGIGAGLSLLGTLAQLYSAYKA
jgi:hypothetical protein